MKPILHYKQKEQAINLRQKYFNYYNTCTYSSSKPKRNKHEIWARINFIPKMAILHYKQKEQAINFCQIYFHPYDTYTLLLFHQKQKERSNKFALEIFSSL